MAQVNDERAWYDDKRFDSVRAKLEKARSRVRNLHGSLNTFRSEYAGEPEKQDAIMNITHSSELIQTTWD